MTSTEGFKRRPLAPGLWPITGPRRPLTAAEIEKFFSKVGEPDENGCRLWIGNHSSNGYGHFYLNRSYQEELAHRVAWEIANGPIPDGLWALHRCDVRPCVNVEHLFLGDAQTNVDDMRAKGRYNCVRGEQHGSTSLTEEKVLQVFQLLAENKLTHEEIGNKFDVDRRVIEHINTGNTWRHLRPEGWVPCEGLRAKGERHGCAKLTEDEVRQIYRLAWEGSLSEREIGEMFGVTARNVAHIKHRRNWKHLWKEENEKCHR